MDLLVALGTTAAYAYGIVLIFHYALSVPPFGLSEEQKMDRIMEHVHLFETSTALITIISLGKYIENFSKKQVIDKITQLESLKTEKATLIH
jgi:cation transport ATPase